MLWIIVYTVPMLLVFFLFFSVIHGSQNVYSDSITIESGETATVGPGDTVIINSFGATNELNNLGTLDVQGNGKIVIDDNGNFFNDVSAVTNLDSDGLIEIGTPGATVSLTNHGTINGPGEFNLFGAVINIENTGVITAIINQFLDDNGGGDNGKAVSGKIIPIETISLLMTGAQTNAVWLIPVVTTLIGFAIFIARRN